MEFAMTDFDKALKYVLEIEGEFVDHPDDPGGKTRWGITEVVARNNGYTGPMEKLPVDLAKKIYKESYYDAVRADELPWPMCYYLFDMAVNSGPVQAIKTLQKTLRVSVDGILGPQTLAAAQAMGAERQALFLAERAIFYFSLSTFPQFGRGWLKRLFYQAKEIQ
jgi:lysozyme family protein